MDNFFSTFSIFLISKPILYPLFNFNTICLSSLCSYRGITIPEYVMSAKILTESPIEILFAFKNSNEFP